MRVDQRRWTPAEAKGLLNLFVLVALEEFRLSIGTCRAYVRTAAQYLARYGAPPNLHHIRLNPELKAIWSDAQSTSAGLVKRAAIIGLEFLQRARDLSRGFPHGQQHYTGLLLSFFFFLRYSEFAGDGDAARAGPLLATDLVFFVKAVNSLPNRRAVLHHSQGHLASVIGLRIKGSKTDSAGIGTCRCASQPHARSGIDLAGQVAEAAVAARACEGAPVLLPALTYQEYNRFIKSVGASMGLDTCNITSHIGRRSAATALAAAGCKEEVREAGRWSSDAWEQYVETCVHLCEGRSDRMLQAFTYLLPD